MRALLALDMYEKTEEPIAQAVGWALRMGATLDLVTASEMLWNGNELFGSTENSALAIEWERRSESLKRTLERRLPEIPERIRGTARVIEGAAASALIDASAGYDLIILSTHGRKGLARLFAGSVAERVVRSVSCSVLITRLDVARIPETGKLKVIFPIDSNEPSVVGIRRARQILGTDYDFQAMCASPDMATLDEHPSITFARERLGLATTTGGLPDIPRVVRVGNGNPGEIIAAYAEEIGASLIAMPTHSRSLLGRLAYGSVAERVVRVAPCAVLITR